MDRTETGDGPRADIRHPNPFNTRKTFAGTEQPALSFGGIRAERSAMVSPETRYARSGNVRIAYQVVGSGPPSETP